MLRGLTTTSLTSAWMTRLRISLACQARAQPRAVVDRRIELEAAAPAHEIDDIVAEQAAVGIVGLRGNHLRLGGGFSGNHLGHHCGRRRDGRAKRVGVGPSIGSTFSAARASSGASLPR